MNKFIFFILIFISTLCFANDYNYLVNNLNSQIEYNIIFQTGQTTIIEKKLNVTGLDNNKCIENYKNSEIYKYFDINELGEYNKNLYENENYIIKLYNTYKFIEEKDKLNNKQCLFHITLLNKKTNQEKIIMYFKYIILNDIKEVKFYNVKLLDENNLLIPIETFGDLFVYSVNNFNMENQNSIIYKYNIPTLLIDSLKIKSIDFISNNIIKINRENLANNTKYNEYWKIYQNDSDIKNNVNFQKEQFNNENINNIYLNKLIWKLNISKKFNYLSYDYFDQEEEPTIEQLKEKFPNDIFFE